MKPLALHLGPLYCKVAQCGIFPMLVGVVLHHARCPGRPAFWSGSFDSDLMHLILLKEDPRSVSCFICA